MARWAFNSPKSNSRFKDVETDIFIGALLSHKSSGIELMQNCDLPPPSKVFAGPDQTAVNRTFNPIENRADSDSEKLELLKALRLSQTRAREAEKRAASLVREREMICSAFLGESMKLLAYRNWVRFLEIKVSNQEKKNCGHKLDEEESEGFSWFAALAICLGIAFGCSYFF